LKLYIRSGKVKEVSVDMGKGIAEDKITLKNTQFTPVSVGNPHAVTFVENIDNAPIDTLGPCIEKNSYFKDGVNVEFVEVIDEKTIRMRVWERGSGITMACGTGACASTLASIKNGYCKYDEEISVILDGGILKIKINKNNEINMTGPCETVYEGEVK